MQVLLCADSRTAGLWKYLDDLSVKTAISLFYATGNFKK
jgi:hypothetical protein